MAAASSNVIPAGFSDNVLRDLGHERTGLGRSVDHAAVDQHMKRRAVRLDKPKQVAVAQAVPIGSDAKFRRLSGAVPVGGFLFSFGHFAFYRQALR